jgi:hypothetical protein
MKKISILFAAVALMASSLSMADFPNYYPTDGFQRVGTLDGVQLGRQVVVIDDIPYSLANSVIVHSPSSYSVPSSQLRIGSKVGYKMAAGGRLITEIWLLPDDYKNLRRRR